MIVDVCWQCNMLNKIGIRQKLSKGNSMAIRSVIDMDVEITSDEEWMRCSGECSEHRIEFR